MQFRTSIEIHLTGDTREAPEVLVLEIRPIAPSHHLHGNKVLSRLEIFRDIELGSHLAVLAVSHVLAVHPESQVTGGRTHVEIHILTLPVLRKLERTAIRTRIVVELADVRRVRVKLSCPGISDVLIGSITISVQLKQTRHREILPL